MSGNVNALAAQVCEALAERSEFLTGVQKNLLICVATINRTAIKN
jgi:hypothetical protein